MPCVQPRRNSIHGVAARKHEHVDIGDVGRDHQGRGAEAGASIEAGGATRSADQRVTNVIHCERSPKICASKTKSARATPPGVRGESGFDTRMIEERIAVPSVLARDLRQQQSAVRALLDNQPMTADFDFLDRLDLALGREHRDLDVDVVEFLRRDRVEPRIRVGDRLRQLATQIGRIGSCELSRPRQPRSSPREKIDTNAPHRTSRRTACRVDLGEHRA